MEQQENTITKKVFSQLEKDELVPISRWRFVLKDKSFWLLWGISVFIGSCAIAVIIFIFFNAGWEYQTITHDSFNKFLFDTIPFFWILSFISMIIFGYYNIRNTSIGYRFSFYLVLFSSIVASFVGGFLLYMTGVAGHIDDIRKSIPFAEPFIDMREHRWNDINKGLVSGVVKSFDDKLQILILKLPDGQEKIFSTFELQDEDKILIKTGYSIRLIEGVSIDKPDTFVACLVLTKDFKHLFERKYDFKRINTCKDVKPYKSFQEAFIKN